MLKCFFIERKLSQFIDDEISSQKHEKIKDHLKHCSKCREVYDRYLNIDRNVKEMLATKIETIVPYKEPYIEASQLVYRKDRKRKTPILHAIRKYLEKETTWNGRVYAFNGKLAISGSWMRIINAIFVVIGFLLILSSPIHGF